MPSDVVAVRTAQQRIVEQRVGRVSARRQALGRDERGRGGGSYGQYRHSDRKPKGSSWIHVFFSPSPSWLCFCSSSQVGVWVHIACLTPQPIEITVLYGKPGDAGDCFCKLIRRKLAGNELGCVLPSQVAALGGTPVRDLP